MMRGPAHFHDRKQLRDAFSRAVFHSEITVKAARMWKNGLDTFDIARALGKSEAEIYNVLSAFRQRRD